MLAVIIIFMMGPAPVGQGLEFSAASDHGFSQKSAELEAWRGSGEAVGDQ